MRTGRRFPIEAQPENASRSVGEFRDTVSASASIGKAGTSDVFRTMSRRYAAWPLSSRYSLMIFHPKSFLSLPSLYHSIYSPSRRENSSNGTPVQSLPSKKSHLSAPKNPSARVVGAPGPPRHRAHHPEAARFAPLAPHVDGATVGVHRERLLLRRDGYPHQVPSWIGNTYLDDSGRDIPPS